MVALLTHGRQRDSAALSCPRGAARRKPAGCPPSFNVAITPSGDPAASRAISIEGIVRGAPPGAAIVVDWTRASGKAGATAFATDANGTRRVHLLTIGAEATDFPIVIRASTVSNTDVGKSVVIERAVAKTLARARAAEVYGAAA